MRLLTLALLVTGCQVVAGIDDRAVAPPLDTGTVAIDSTTVDTGMATPDVAADTGSPMMDTTIASDTPAEADAPADIVADAPPAIGVVVNEVRASGQDYLEITNNSSATVDISNWGVTGTDDAGGFSVPVRFSAGEKLGPGEHLLILAGMTVAVVGPQTACGIGGPMRCYHATWGISQSRGEVLRVLRADDSIANEVSYPMNGHPDGSSWGRIPDGTGSFVVTKPTPGAANAL